MKNCGVCRRVVCFFALRAVATFLTAAQVFGQEFRGMPMSLKAARESKFLLAVSCLLLITITPWFATCFLDEVSDPSRLEAIGKAPTKSLSGLRQKITDRPVLVINKTKVNLNFVSYSFLLRFDYKQNLRAWPVLSNDLERSPPSIRPV
jgi:hypothetical protein